MTHDLVRRARGALVPARRLLTALVLAVLLAATVATAVFAHHDYEGVRQEQVDHSWLAEHGHRTRALVVEEGLSNAHGVMQQYWARPVGGHEQYFIDATGSRTAVTTLGQEVTVLVGDRFDDRVGIPVDTTRRHFSHDYLVHVAPLGCLAVLLAAGALLTGRCLRRRDAR